MTHQAKIIKRYANRKLYDTERSCYVTLDEIAQMVKGGEDIQVIDNKSKDDLTAVTLAQIIVEEQKKVARMPLKLLRIIIQNSNDALGYFYQKKVADPVQHFRDDVEKRVDVLFRKEKEGEEAGDAENGSPDIQATPRTADESEDQDDDNAQNPVRTFVNSATDTFDSWQRNVDERVKDAFAKMPQFANPSAEFEELQKRVSALDARLKEVEVRRENKS